MGYTIVRFKVADYAAWKRIFDEGAALRRANGSRGAMAFQDINDPHAVVLLIDWENADIGWRFGQSAEIQEIRRKGGVTEFEPYKPSDRFEA